MTSQEKQFIRAYVLTGNATKSARLAGFSGSYFALGARGHRLLQRADIREAIAQKITKIKGKIQ